MALALIGKGQIDSLNPKTRSAWNIVFENMFGEELDLGGIVEQVSIYESIYNDCVFGNVLLNDAQGFTERQQIVGAGDEKIHIKIETTGSAEVNSNFEKTFRVNSYTGSTYAGDGTGTISSTMGFVSPHLIKNNRTRIKRSFNSMTASEIVEYISYDIMKFGQSFDIEWDDLQTNEPTKHIKNVIIPGWSPFKTCNWLAEQSISLETASSNYLFYENNSGFHFRSLDSLKSEDVIREYIVGVNMTNTVVGNENEMYIRTDILENVSQPSRFNHTQSQLNGLYGGSLMTHNILTKQFNTYDIEYDENEFNMGEAGLNGDMNFASSSQSSIGFMPDEYMYNIHHTTEKSHYPHRDMKLAEMRTNIIKFDVAGDTNLWAGSMINVSFPTNIRENSDTPVDKFLSGKWMITAIHHKINNMEYVMTIECMKDSFNTKPE